MVSENRVVHNSENLGVCDAAYLGAIRRESFVESSDRKFSPRECSAFIVVYHSELAAEVGQVRLVWDRQQLCAQIRRLSVGAQDASDDFGFGARTLGAGGVRSPESSRPNNSLRTLRMRMTSICASATRLANSINSGGASPAI
jgi:hypothetical protein